MKTWVTRILLGLLVLALIFMAWAVGSMLRPGPGPSVAINPAGKQIQISGGVLPVGCSCHSKNQKVIDQHKKYGITDCNKCHAGGMPKNVAAQPAN